MYGFCLYIEQEAESVLDKFRYVDGSIFGLLEVRPVGPGRLLPV